MKVLMIKQTKWNGEVLRPGDTIDIESNTANRWINNGIAGPCDSGENPATASNGELEITRESLQDLKYNQLREKAAENGIKVPRGTKKPDLIDLILTEAAPAEENQETEGEEDIKEKEPTSPDGKKGEEENKKKESTSPDGTEGAA